VEHNIESAWEGFSDILVTQYGICVRPGEGLVASAALPLQRLLRATHRPANRPYQKRRALIIINPQLDQHDKCKQDIESVLKRLEHDAIVDFAINRPRTKSGRLAARKLGAALKRCAATLRQQHLSVGLQQLCGLRYFRHIHDAAEDYLEAARHCEAFAQQRPKKLPRAKADAKRRAITAAFWLLTTYGSKAVSLEAAPRSNFCKLSSLLFDGGKTNLVNQCKAELRNRRQCTKPQSAECSQGRRKRVKTSGAIQRSQ
jgi:hypothetical protein